MAERETVAIMKPKLSLKLAQRTARCRICGKAFAGHKDFPSGWSHNFGSLIFPVHVTLNFGKECAHAECLKTYD